MSRLLFWNVARSGGSLDSLSGVELCEDLAGLGEDPACKPDIMVLCECNKGFDEKPDQCPADYSFCRPDTSRAKYVADTTLRYALLYKKATVLNCKGFLLHTGTPGSVLRPAIGIVANKISAVALHAASISTSVGVQISQIKRAFDEFVKHPQGRRPLT